MEKVFVATGGHKIEDGEYIPQSILVEWDAHRKPINFPGDLKFVVVGRVHGK
jgi:hypothetical protein